MSETRAEQHRVTDLWQIVEPMLWKQMETHFFLFVVTAVPVGHQSGKHCTCWNL